MRWARGLAPFAALALAGCSASDEGACTSPPAPAEPKTLCAFAQRLEVAYDATFTQRERAELDAARDAWREATGGRIDLALAGPLAHADAMASPPAASVVHVARLTPEGDAARVAELDALAGGFPVRGFSDRRVIELVAPRLSPPPRLTQIAIHELGHVLGLAHDPSRDAIMHAVSDDVNACLRERPRPAALDLAQLAARRCGS